MGGASTSKQSRVITDQTRLEEEVFVFAGGSAALFSAKSPDREGGNEDGAAIAALGESRGVMAVADGLGGQAGGASAADLALTHLKSAVAQSAPETLRSAILDGIETANQAILDLGIGAATTLSVAEISGRALRTYQVGDSAILVTGQRGKIKLQTLSHSPVGYAVESGLMDEQEALHHEERHLVSNMVGSPEMRIEMGSALQLAPRDTVLLATDGLLDNLTAGEIVDLIRTGPLRQAARRLAEACDARMRAPAKGAPSKPDDCTFILFRLDS